MESGVDVDFLTPFFYEKIKVFPKTIDGIKFWHELINAYHKEIVSINEFALELAKEISKALAGSLIHDLIIDDISDEQKKALAVYFTNNYLHEWTENNENLIKAKIINLITSVDLSWKAEFYYRLFSDTTADLFMIKTLALSKKEYLEKFKNLKDDSQTGPFRKSNPENYGTKSSVESSASNYSAYAARRKTILDNWTTWVGNENTHSPISNTYSFTNGIDEKNLRSYLFQVKDFLDKFCQQDKIVDLKNNYALLKSRSDSADTESNLNRAVSELMWIRKYV
jgi:hypothetical protein